MKLFIYHIDAFADKAFEGNPAAVVPLTQWLPDETLQAIAEQNNLAETAFYIPSGSGFHIRWFTPTKEVKLCGHATLASAYVLFNIIGHSADVIEFQSLSGPLRVSQNESLLTLDFPSQPPQICNIPDAVIKGLGRTPVACLRNEDLIAVFERKEDVAEIAPDHHYIKQLDIRALIATAPSSDFDFVARVFAPRYGIPEDPVTGSAYTQLMPYWSERIGRTVLTAKQLSPRGGKLSCEIRGDRIHISGAARKYLEGTIEI